MEQQKSIHEIVAAVRKLVRSVYLDSTRTGRKFGVSGAQNLVLRNLNSHGPLSSADLSRKLFVTPANMTGIVDRLETKGLVGRQRKAGDRRVVLITLTEAGQELSDSLPDPVESKLRYGLRDKSPEEVAHIALSMTTLLSLVDAEDIEDVPLALAAEGHISGEAPKQ
jgi:DNA-binding MarR family transcriptional regulator